MITCQIKKVVGQLLRRLKWGRCPYFAAYCLGKNVDIPGVTFCQFGKLHLWGIKFLIEHFRAVAITNFPPDWEPEILNQPSLQMNSSENWCHCAKVRFTEGFFSSRKKSSKKKESIQDHGSNIKFSYERLTSILLKDT